MKTHFPGYFLPTDDEFEQMWREGIFSFDANVLLNIYLYSEKTRDEFFDTLELLQDRLWLPHQAAFEFHKNRLGTINKQKRAYSELQEQLDSFVKKFEAKLSGYRRHPSLNSKGLSDQAREAVGQIKTLLQQMEEAHPDYTGITDPLKGRLVALFEGKVGDPYSEEDLAKKHKAAAARYDRHVPPGYADLKEKGIPEVYGDAVLWFQLLDYAASEKKPLIFVTDDAKEDWWLLDRSGKTIGPRPELVSEMREVAGVQFYLYPTSQFLEYAAKHLGFRVSEHAVEEAQEVGEQTEQSYDVWMTSYSATPSPVRQYASIDYEHTSSQLANAWQYILQGEVRDAIYDLGVIVRSALHNLSIAHGLAGTQYTGPSNLSGMTYEISRMNAALRDANVLPYYESKRIDDGWLPLFKAATMGPHIEQYRLPCGLSEENARVLHREVSAFVDRYFSVDPSASR